jgi:hypothetical protein
MVYVNVLKDLFDWIGDENYHYSSHTGYLRIFDMEWKILGGRDEASEKFVRGSTVGIAVCDEVVLMPEGFFQDVAYTHVAGRCPIVWQHES